MDRRTFVKTTVGASVLFGTGVKFGSLGKVFAGQSVPYDLVAVKGGEPDVMFDQAIAALGGMKTFVKKGQKVVVKPNIGWDVGPQRAANTNPKLVTRVIQHCFQAGASEVSVFDHTCDDWRRCYSSSGLEAAAKSAGAKVVPGNADSYYHDVTLSRGKIMKNARVHELILEADVFINMPVLKNHNSSKLTIAMKNLMGIVWDRGFWHANNLHQCIADFAGYRAPDLNIVDAYAVMTRNGPRGVSDSDVVTMKAQLLSTDIVAVDAAAAKLAGQSPEDIGYITLAAAQGFGRKDLGALNIKRITV